MTRRPGVGTSSRRRAYGQAGPAVQGGVYPLPHSHVEGAPLDMSFSGLKTAVVNLAHHAEQVGEPLDAQALARDFAQAVSDTLVPRAMEAAKQSGRTVIVAAGGVATNPSSGRT